MWTAIPSVPQLILAVEGPRSGGFSLVDGLTDMDDRDRPARPHYYELNVKAEEALKRSEPPLFTGRGPAADRQPARTADRELKALARHLDQQRVNTQPPAHASRRARIDRRSAFQRLRAPQRAPSSKRTTPRSGRRPPRCAPFYDGGPNATFAGDSQSCRSRRASHRAPYRRACDLSARACSATPSGWRSNNHLSGTSSSPTSRGPSSTCPRHWAQASWPRPSRYPRPARKARSVAQPVDIARRLDISATVFRDRPGRAARCRVFRSEKTRRLWIFWIADKRKTRSIRHVHHFVRSRRQRLPLRSLVRCCVIGERARTGRGAIDMQPAPCS